MHDETVQCVADAYATGLGIGDDTNPLFKVTRRVEICIHHACSGLYAGDLGVVPDEIYQAPATARDDQVHVSHRFEQFLRGVVRGRKEVHRVGIGAGGGHDALDERYGRAVGVVRVAAALQQARAAALEAQGEHVEGDVGPGFIDDSDDSERHAHLPEFQAIGKCPLNEDTA